MNSSLDYNSIYETTKESYNKVASEFAKKNLDTTCVVSLMQPFITNLPKGGLILDAGCGPGRDSVLLIEEGYKVIGVDFSEEMVKIASTVPGLKVILADFRDLDFPDNKFDGIWANASLHHLVKTDLIPVLTEFARILKSGGTLFVSLKRGDLEDYTDEYPSCPRYYSKYYLKEIKEIFDQAHLDIISTNSCMGGVEQEKWILVYARKPQAYQLEINKTCTFCDLVDLYFYSKNTIHPLELYSFNKPLHISSDFVVVPALGHIVEGYVVVLSKNHKLSMGALSKNDLRKLEEVKTLIRNALEPIFGPYTFFEHGTVDDDRPAGNSILHGHIHGFPSPNNFIKFVLQSLPFNKVDTITFLKDSYKNRKSYLFLETPYRESFGYLPSQGLPPQYFRRYLARTAGEFGRWNWRYYPFIEKADNTLFRILSYYGKYTF